MPKMMIDNYKLDFFLKVRSPLEFRGVFGDMAFEDKPHVDNCKVDWCFEFESKLNSFSLSKKITLFEMYEIVEQIEDFFESEQKGVQCVFSDDSQGKSDIELSVFGYFDDDKNKKCMLEIRFFQDIKNNPLESIVVTVPNHHIMEFVEKVKDCTMDCFVEIVKKHKNIIADGHMAKFLHRDINCFCVECTIVDNGKIKPESKTFLCENSDVKVGDYVLVPQLLTKKPAVAVVSRVLFLSQMEADKLKGKKVIQKATTAQATAILDSEKGWQYISGQEDCLPLNTLTANFDGYVLANLAFESGAGDNFDIFIENNIDAIMRCQFHNEEKPSKLIIEFFDMNKLCFVLAKKQFSAKIKFAQLHFEEDKLIMQIDDKNSDAIVAKSARWRME